MDMPALVDCPPMKSRMTAAGCVRLWRSGQERPPAPHEARSACMTCALGPQRAGIDVASAERQARAAALAAAMRQLCPRCERVAGRLINGRFCISCYNRDREARIGRNAKGTPPSIAARIHAATLAVAPGAEPPRVIAVERVVSRIEAIAVAARQAGPGATIGVAPLTLAVPETAEASAA